MNEVSIQELYEELHGLQHSVSQVSPADPYFEGKVAYLEDCIGRVIDDLEEAGAEV